MKKSRAILLGLLLVCSRLFAQQGQAITGHVYRQGTDSIIPYATIYFNGSSGSTSSDKNGYFELKATSANIPLIISSIGYYSATVTGYNFDKPLKVYLKPKAIELNEVVISYDAMPRAEKEKIFLREFLGISDNSKSCTILNMDSIVLRYQKTTNTLSAYCNGPIIIRNKNLGYLIDYYLDNFSKADSKVAFTGNYLFKEDPLLNTADLKKAKEEREAAYLGSRMHFIRSLWNGSLAQNGFQLFGFDLKPIEGSTLVLTNQTGEKFLNLVNNLAVLYKKTATSNLRKIGNSPFFIDKDGFYAAGIYWTGQMGMQRIGDLLPFEYAPDATTKPIADTVALTQAPIQIDQRPDDQASSKKEIAFFFEKTYLHIDRETYSPGEDIWFKAYLVHAQNNRLFNSSNNLYVELISPQSKIIERKTIRMDNGLGKGDFKLNDSIATGTYRLRAYTNWMRNFGDNLIFEKEIKIFTITGDDIEKAAKSISAPAAPVPAIAPVTSNIAANAAFPSIQFFPEGGSATEGVAGMLAFKTGDLNGKPVAAKGIICTIGGEKITEFACGTEGMGKILFLPSAGIQYQASGIFADGRSFKAALPPALSTGFAMTVRNSDSLIVINIGTNLATLNVQQGKNLVLLAKNKGKTYYTAQIPLSGPQLRFSIPKAMLPAGITSLTLYDGLGKPACERLVYAEGTGGLTLPSKQIKPSINHAKK